MRGSRPAIRRGGSGIGGSGARSAQSHLLRAQRRSRTALGNAGAAALQPPVLLVCGLEPG